MTKKYERVEVKLDDELMTQFVGTLEDAINVVVSANSEKDSRLELFTTLLSFAAQVAQDIGMEDKSFLKLSKQFFAEAEATAEEVPLDKSKVN
jgi:hypothetical protein